MNTRTRPCSAHVTRPLSSVFPTVTWNAAAVLARSMRSVKRTEIATLRATPVSSARGRKRTTAGAWVVRTASDGGSSKAVPSVSTRPASESR